MDYTGSSKNITDCDLCKKVEKKLGEDRISEPLRKELKQVDSELAEATAEYLKYQLLVDSVKKFLNQKLDKKAENGDQAVLSDPLYLTLIKKYSSADGIQAFGITEDFIDKIISRKQKTQLEKEELNAFVEGEINHFCDKITEYAGCTQKYRGNKKRAFEESVKTLSSEIDALAVTKCRLKSDEEDMDNLLLNYFENLQQGVSMLKSLVSLQEQKLEFQSSLGNLYMSRQSALVSKINQFEHQVLAATYDKRSVEALTKIREELDQNKVMLDNDLNRTNSDLQTYSILGSEYEKLVNEYTELLKQIQNQTWSNESLKRRQSFGGPLSDKEEFINSFEQEAVDQEAGSNSSELEAISDSKEIDKTLDCAAMNDEYIKICHRKSSVESLKHGEFFGESFSDKEEFINTLKLVETPDCSKLDGTNNEETDDDSKENV